MVGQVSTSPRYVIDITRPDLLSLGELGGGNLEKLEKYEVFLT